MSVEPRYPLILNPRARSERAQRARRFVMEHATRFAIYATNSAEESAELARRFSEEGEGIVVAAGGDGTLNAVVGGLSGSETVLGILPTGTMNVFARELNIPFGHLESALEVIDAGHVKEVDLFQAEGTAFVQMAGVGFDAQVIEETTMESKRRLGALAYILSAVKVLGSKPPRMKVYFDEGAVAEGACVLLGNGALYGGQLRLFGKADNADDLLDVLVYKEAGYKAALGSLGTVARGGFEADGKAVEYYQTSGLTVECDREVPVEVDGELWGRSRRVEFKAMAEKLRVLAPEERGKNWWEQILSNLSPGNS
ncbi:MAG: diacylglycerol kinase family lipid kinase [Roseibacillus sp.]|nr:diacylglycerol kinase family lipid kinase [Roseibacillus sp.]